MPKRTPFFGVACFFFFFLFFQHLQAGQNILRLSFFEALRLAQKNPVNVQVAREKVTEALARMQQARSAFLPHASTTVSEMRQTKNLAAQGIELPGQNPLVGPFNTFDARIRITQNILDATFLASLALARSEKDLALAQERKTRDEAVALVGELYLEAQRAEQKEKVNRLMLARDEETLKVAKANLQMGLGTKVEVEKAQVLAASSFNRLAQSHTDSLERKKDLLAALGMPLDQQIIFSGKTENFFILPLPNEVIQNSQNHPEVGVAQKNVARALSNKKLQQVAFFPKIGAGADYGASGVSPRDSTGTYAYGAEMQFDLFQGGLRLAKLKEAKSQLKQNELLLKDAKTRSEARAEVAREKVLGTQTLVRAVASQMQSAKKEADVTRGRFLAGTASRWDVLDREANLAWATDQYQEAYATLNLASLNLVYAMGKIEEYLEKLK